MVKAVLLPQVIQEKVRREDLLHAVANTLKVHLDYVEPLKVRPR